MNAGRTCFVFVVLLSAAVFGFGQAGTPDFRTVVEGKFRDALPKGGLAVRCPIYDDWVAARVFVEYGAMFVTETPALPPAKCIVQSEAELSAAQAFLNARSANIGGTTVTLQ